jgi:hypothetical protein
MDNIASEIPPRGNFSFINCEWSKEMLQSAFDAVESVQGGWEALLPEPSSGGFMFSPRPPGSVLRQIDSAISERYSGHSGASYGCTMRNMQGIARLGWDDYVRFYRNRSEQSVQQAQSINQIHSTNSNKPVISDIPVFSILDCKDSNQICPICLEYLVIEKLNVYVLHDGSLDGSNTNPVKCGHKYHFECIREWAEKKRTCPICRSDIKIIAPLAK